MKNVYFINTKERGDKIRRVAIRKLNHLSSGACWCIVLQEDVKVKLSPQVCESDYFGRFCGYSVKTLTVCHQWTIRHRRRAAVQQVCQHGCNKPVCTCGTLWRQRYITTSKEYLTNSHILSKYFKLVFLQLHLKKFRVNWSSFDWVIKETKRVFFMKHRVVRLSSVRRLSSLTDVLWLQALGLREKN